MLKRLFLGLSIVAVIGIQAGIQQQAIASTVGHAKGLCSYKSATDSSKNIDRQPCTANFGTVMQPELQRDIGFVRLNWMDGVQTKIVTTIYRYDPGNPVITIDGKTAQRYSDCEGTRYWAINGNQISFRGKFFPQEKSESCD